jgi:predicted nucleic acid-binding Zn ribbon protein
MSDAPPERCEVCGEAPVERVLFPVAVHFKGSGFYSTDYGRGSRKHLSGKDGDASSTTSSSSESSSSSDSASSSDSGPTEKKKAAEA